MNSYAMQAYKTQQNSGVSPVEVVAILYDRMIVSLREAAEAAEAKEIERRWKANTRATQIIGHLRTALDLEQGGDVAANLDRLYGFALTRLIDVDQKNDAKAAREVAGLMEPIRDSWKQLSKQGGNAAQAQQPNQPQAPRAPQGYGGAPAGGGSLNLST